MVRLRLADLVRSRPSSNRFDDASTHPIPVFRMMWAAGVLASVSSITYPAISAFVSMHSDADKQGLVQGMVTGMRGLCNGLGPAMFGVIFSLFHVDLNDDSHASGVSSKPSSKPSLVGDNRTSATNNHLDVMPQASIRTPSRPSRRSMVVDET